MTTARVPLLLASLLLCLGSASAFHVDTRHHAPTRILTSSSTCMSTRSSSLQQHHHQSTSAMHNVRPRLTLSSSLRMAAAASEDASSNDPEKQIIDTTSEDVTPSTTSLGQRFRNYFRGPQDGLTTKQRLAKMGLAVALSYGWVSNMSYTVTVSIAWYIFSRQVRGCSLGSFLMVWIRILLFESETSGNVWARCHRRTYHLG